MKFFSAKANVIIDRNDAKEDFTAHIRFNTKDTLWISFTGTFGIEGARMLVTPDTTFIINKLDKTAFAYTNDQANDLIPYTFTFDDWRVLLLNLPYTIDSFANQESDKSWTITRRDSKVNFKEKQQSVISCNMQQFSTNMTCKLEFEDFKKQDKLNIANQRTLNISGGSDNTFKIIIRYVDYKLNKPEPFVFNFAKYRNVEP